MEVRDVQGRSWHAALAVCVLVLVAVMAMGANPFAGQTVGPYDLLISEKGWNQDTGAVAVRSWERTDILDAMVPRWMFARRALRAGELPLWNPLVGGGEAGIQNLANSQLTPAFAIFAAAPTPAIGFYFATLFNLAMTGIGAWFWLRRSVGTLPALFGAVTVMLCGFNVAWLYWPHMSTAVWVCWLLWAVQEWWYRPGPWRFLALVCVTALLLLGGFPFVTELGLGAALAYVLVLGALSSEPAVKRSLGVLGGVVLAAGLAAIPLLSFVGWLTHVDTVSRTGGSPLRLVPDALRLLPWAARDEPRVESHLYVGGLAVLAAVAALLRWIRPRQVEPLLALATLLLVVSAVLVFELVPPVWLGGVPGLGGNGWSRAIILLDIALAALASCGLAWLVQRTRTPAWGLAVVLPLLLLQIVDLGTMFRRFNGPVQADWMFPSTPQIAQAQAGITSFGYVVSDANYIVSGTLAAYGLADWYGHGFKSAATKLIMAQAVQSPFTTATASVIEPASIRLDSRAIRAMAIRYALGDERLIARTWEPQYTQGPDAMSALPALRDQEWIQLVDLESRFDLTHVLLRIATYGGKGLKGELVLAVSAAEAPDTELAQAILPAADLVDGEMAEFAFRPAIALPKGRYALTLQHRDSAADENVTAWYRPGATKNCALKMSSERAPGCLIMRLLSARDDMDGWRVVSQDRGLVLLENTDAPRGPYFVSSLADAPHGKSADTVRTTGSFADGWTLRYTGNVPGYVVLPMTATRSWIFEVDGRPADVKRYLDALPAIPVPHAATVTARYQSRSIQQGRWIFLASVVLLFGATGALFAWRRRQPPRGG